MKQKKKPLINNPIITRREGIKGKVTIGNKAKIHNDVEIDATGNIIIENYATVYHGTIIITHKHHWEHSRDLRDFNQTIERVNLRIGRDAFIGQGAMLVAVKEIGNGAVIGAGSVVTKSVPPFEIWAGNPAKKIGERRDK